MTRRPIFHVVNGDSTLGLLRESAVPGEAIVWPDMLMEGPLRAGPGGGLDWAARARFLAKFYGVERRLAAARIAAYRKALDLAAAAGGEVVLWFEEDWFCQVNLLGLLATLPPALRRKGRFSLICPAKPLAYMSPKGLERLFARRQPPGRARLALASRAWKALASPTVTGKVRKAGNPSSADPSVRKLNALLAREGAFAAWPLLRRGLAAHLDRLPGVDGRPGSLEYAIGEALVDADGKGLAFPDLYRAVAAHPRIRPLGIGDAQVACAVLDLAARRDAPVRILGEGRKRAPSDPLAFRGARIALAERR